MDLDRDGLGATLLSLASYAERIRHGQLKKQVARTARIALAEIPDGYTDDLLRAAADFGRPPSMARICGRPGPALDGRISG